MAQWNLTWKCLQGKVQFLWKKSTPWHALALAEYLQSSNSHSLVRVTHLRSGIRKCAWKSVAPLLMQIFCFYNFIKACAHSWRKCISKDGDYVGKIVFCWWKFYLTIWLCSLEASVELNMMHYFWSTSPYVCCVQDIGIYRHYTDH